MRACVSACALSITITDAASGHRILCHLKRVLRCKRQTSAVDHLQYHLHAILTTHAAQMVCGVLLQKHMVFAIYVAFKMVYEVEANWWQVHVKRICRTLAGVQGCAHLVRVDINCIAALSGVLRVR